MPDETARLSIATPEVGVFVLSGEIDAHTAPQFEERCDPRADAIGDTLVVDMSGVTFMDSSGLRVLIDLHRRGSEAGVAVKVRAPSRSVAKLIDISGLSDLIEVSPA